MGQSDSKDEQARSNTTSASARKLEAALRLARTLREEEAPSTNEERVRANIERLSRAVEQIKASPTNQAQKPPGPSQSEHPEFSNTPYNRPSPSVPPASTYPGFSPTPKSPSTSAPVVDNKAQITPRPSTNEERVRANVEKLSRAVEELKADRPASSINQAQKPTNPFAPSTSGPANTGFSNHAQGTASSLTLEARVLANFEKISRAVEQRRAHSAASINQAQKLTNPFAPSPSGPAKTGFSNHAQGTASSLTLEARVQANFEKISRAVEQRRANSATSINQAHRNPNQSASAAPAQPGYSQPQNPPGPSGPASTRLPKKAQRAIAISHPLLPESSIDQINECIDQKIKEFSDESANSSPISTLTSKQITQPPALNKQPEVVKSAQEQTAEMSDEAKKALEERIRRLQEKMQAVKLAQQEISNKNAASGSVKNEAPNAAPPADLTLENLHAHDSAQADNANVNRRNPRQNKSEADVQSDGGYGRGNYQRDDTRGEYRRRDNNNTRGGERYRQNNRGGYQRGDQQQGFRETSKADENKEKTGNGADGISSESAGQNYGSNRGRSYEGGSGYQRNDRGRGNYRGRGAYHDRSRSNVRDGVAAENASGESSEQRKNNNMEGGNPRGGRNQNQRGNRGRGRGNRRDPSAHSERDAEQKPRYYNDECHICLNGFEPEHGRYMVLDCLHRFHNGCALEWAKGRDKLACAICSRDIDRNL